jgi:hypothetical protein
MGVRVCSSLSLFSNREQNDCTSVVVPVYYLEFAYTWSNSQALFRVSTSSITRPLLTSLVPALILRCLMWNCSYLHPLVASRYQEDPCSTNYFPSTPTECSPHIPQGATGSYSASIPRLWHIMVIIAHLTQAYAATIINAVLAITQSTLGLAVIVVLVYFMYNTNSAIAWSGVTRTIHSSFWPDLLRTDSTSSGSTWSRISIISNLSVIGGVLIAIAGVVTPLGLDEGPPVQTDYVLMGASASYVRDESPIGRATSPRDKFTYGRLCGSLRPVPCPGNGLNANTSQISLETFRRFNSTLYGPFNMQFRRYYHGIAGYNHAMTLEC